MPQLIYRRLYPVATGNTTESCEVCVGFFSFLFFYFSLCVAHRERELEVNVFYLTLRLDDGGIHCSKVGASERERELNANAVGQFRSRRGLPWCLSLSLSILHRNSAHTRPIEASTVILPSCLSPSVERRLLLLENGGYTTHTGPRGKISGTWCS